MSGNDWEAFARSDPYWAVLTNPRFRSEDGELSPESRAAFFGGGRGRVQRMVATLKQHFNRSFGPQDCCIDFGSGVGRLLIPMAKHCGRAIGIDVSDTMRRICMDNALAFKAGNVECYADIDHPALGEASFDWVNSFIVFQHLETEAGYRVLQKLLKRVRPNGAISLHFTIYKDMRLQNYLSDRSTYFTVDEKGVKHVISQDGFYREGTMMMNDYDVTRLYMIFAHHGFTRILSEHEDQAGMHGLIFYGIKDGA